VLPAHLVDVDDRQVAFGDTRHRQVESHVFLVARIGRAVRHHHQLGTGLGEALHHVLVAAPFGPDVLADRKPYSHAPEAYPPRNFTAPGRGPDKTPLASPNTP